MSNQPTKPILSAQGAKFICDNFELFRAKPYLDSGGLPTIGYGTRITEKQKIAWKDGISEAQGQIMFQDYMSALTKQLQMCPLANLQQWQYDAIFSLAYNIGFEAFQHSTIYKELMIRGTDLEPWLEWVHDAEGHLDKGLVIRRTMELKLFIYGLY
jgi:lysozyme